MYSGTIHDREVEHVSAVRLLHLLQIIIRKLQIFPKKFGVLKKLRTFAIPFGNYAEIAQLVEHNLAKVGVASSSLVFRSKRSLREI